ncbi:MAG: HTTM domain-containing protein [Planctomycetaceae bacterium]
MDPSRNDPWPRRLARAAFALDVRSLAVYRMALGAILCVDCLLRLRDFDLMFAVDGIFPPAALRRVYADPTLWSLAFLHDATWWSGAVLALEGIAGLLLAAGVATRAATIVAWVALVSVIRRTSPATNAGDTWLGCQLFWSMFVPLGAAWSWDARRRVAAGCPPVRGTVCSVATTALVLQIVFVYVSAGIAKCNATWTSGAAVANALSLHDHGTWLGMALARTGLAGGPLARAVIVLEVAGPLLAVLVPTARVRLAVIATFLVFHVAVWLCMSVGLFVPISLAAWLPLVPAMAWDRGPPRDDVAVAVGLPRPAAWACAAALGLSCVGVLNARWWNAAVPRPFVALVNLTMLNQDWAMFGRVPPLEQWVTARALRADGAVIDLFRGGRPCAGERPAEGFTSLPHHRWHKLCWVLGTPGVRGIAPEVAAGLARHWNSVHDPAERVRSVEIRHVVHGRTDPEDAEYEYVVASWPPRTAAGGGNLDRLLEEAREPDREPR